MARIFILILAFLLAGCVSETISEMSREIVLSAEHPENNFIRAKLVGIAADGTTTIRVLPSGPELQAKVGGYFVSEEFGKHGLELVSAFAEKQEAHLVQYSAEFK